MGYAETARILTIPALRMVPLDIVKVGNTIWLIHAVTLRGLEVLGQKEIDFWGVKAKSETRMMRTSCLWCKFGELQCGKVPIYLICKNKASNNYGKKTKKPTYHKCGEWRYKF